MSLKSSLLIDALNDLYEVIKVVVCNLIIHLAAMVLHLSRFLSPIRLRPHVFRHRFPRLRRLAMDRSLGPDEVQCFMLGSNSELTLLKGNIVEWEGDAIVNAGHTSDVTSLLHDVT